MADIKDVDLEMSHKERSKIFFDGVKEMKDKYRMLHIDVENMTGKSARDLEDAAIDEEIKGNYQMADLLYQQATKAAKQSENVSYISVKVTGNVRKFIDSVVEKINGLADEHGGELDFPASVIDLRNVSGGNVNDPFSFGASYKFD